MSAEAQPKGGGSKQAAPDSFRSLAAARLKEQEALGRRFVEAVNCRVADQIVALAHPVVEFHPARLVGVQRTYRGHEGMRQWIADQVQLAVEYEVRLKEVRTQAHDRFVLFADFLLGGVVMTPLAMVVTLAEGRIIHAHAYLSDEATLRDLGVIEE
jgi:ketosteroid isomerase-like protein